MQRITKEDIKRKKLAFSPQMKGEAQFIQRELFKLGAGWEGSSIFAKKQCKVWCVDACLSDGIYVNGGTMFTGGVTGTIACNSSQLGDGWASDPEFRLTTEIVEKYDLFFHPKDTKEATYLIEKLRAGLVLSCKADVPDILAHGALVTGRRLLPGRAASDTGYTLLHCTMDHFRDYFGANILQASLPAPGNTPENPSPGFTVSDDQRFMRDIFGKLCEKVDAQTKMIVDQQKTIDELQNKVDDMDRILNPHPSKLDKRSLWL
jgi:hypothetical protein